MVMDVITSLMMSFPSDLEPVEDLAHQLDQDLAHQLTGCKKNSTLIIVYKINQPSLYAFSVFKSSIIFKIFVEFDSVAAWNNSDLASLWNKTQFLVFDCRPSP
ncbi:hypothetical protein M8J75_003101 [Diaphorina citri]|nr:hypothetical protein M8J75_003101 [Diaphorina citri]